MEGENKPLLLFHFSKTKTKTSKYNLYLHHQKVFKVCDKILGAVTVLD